MELLLENEVEKALTITASSEAVLFPKENAYSRRLAELYKSESIVSAAVLTFDIELELAATYNRLGIVNHNIEAADTVEIYYDIGAGWVLLEAVTGIEDEQYFYHKLASMPSGTTDIRLSITAGSTKVFSVGWLYFGNALTVISPDFGSSPKLNNTDNNSLSWGRQLFVDEGLNYRTQVIKFNCATETEFNSLLSIWKEGSLRGKPGLFVQFPNTPYSLLEPYFAKATMDILTREYPSIYPYNLTIEEVF